MSLEDYTIDGKDNFKIDQNLALENDFDFPCNVCSERFTDVTGDPCLHCCHNTNCIEDN